MILYILRFSVSIVVFYVFYRMVLEKEKMHRFNRGFLLFGILMSLIAPLVSFGSKPEITEVFYEFEPIIATASYTYNDIFQAFYLMVVGILLIRFVFQLFSFIAKIRLNEVKPYNKAKVVLTDESLPPYTFLNYIFVNRKLKDELPQELMKHEMAHVKQLHSIDIVLIEIVKVLFWINPILGMYKRAIQLNHEFLADDAAIEQIDLGSYQNMLLQYMSHKSSLNLASSLNFSLTKKRFHMMSKTKSNLRTIRMLLVLPVFSFVFFACSDSEGVSGKDMLFYWRYTANMEEILTTGAMNDDDLKDGVILPLETKAQYDRLNEIYGNMNNKQKKSVFKLPPYLEPIKE